MKKSSLVSVIVLHYKQEQYIQACLDSIVNQTYSPLEVFFVDNDSGDLELDSLQEHIRLSALSPIGKIFIFQKHSIPPFRGLRVNLS